MNDVPDEKIDTAIAEITGQDKEAFYEETVRGLVEMLQERPEMLEELVRSWLPDSESCMRVMRGIINDRV